MKFNFKIKKIQQGIYRVTEPYYRECANSYIFKGDKFDLIVDCGIGLEDIKQYLLERGSEKVKLFLTHSHYDHAGGLKYFPAGEVVIMNKISSNIQNRKLWGLEYLKDKDFDRASLPLNFPISPKHFCKAFEITFPTIKPALIRKISNGNFSFIVLYVPGHTDDSFALYESEKKILVTGDALYEGEMYANLKNSNRADFKKSLRKMEKLDFELVLPGHNRELNKKKARSAINNWLSSI